MAGRNKSWSRHVPDGLEATLVIDALLVGGGVGATSSTTAAGHVGLICQQRDYARPRQCASTIACL
jgi:hypothetical protein